MNAGEPPVDAAAWALARAWGSFFDDREAARQAAEAIVLRERAKGRTDVLALSMAFECVNMAFMAAPTYAAALIRRYRPAIDAAQVPRAQWLIDDAAARLDHIDGDREGTVEALIRANLDRPASARPAAERMWTLWNSVLLAQHRRRFDEALRLAERFNECVSASELSSFGPIAAFIVGNVFLSAGDLEGAAMWHTRAAETSARRGKRLLGADANLATIRCLQGDHELASQLWNARPELATPAEGSFHERLYYIGALLALSQGDAHRAVDLFDRNGHHRDWDESSASMAAWIEGKARIACGQPLRGLACCMNYLTHARRAGVEIAPLQSTHLYGTVSQAHEALGNADDAQQALRLSLSECISWISDSMRLRLLDLQSSTTTVEARARVDRGVAAVDAAIRSVRAAMPGAGVAQPAGSDASTSEAVSRAASGGGSEVNMRMLAYVTHEMRNPLNGVIGMTSLLTMAHLDERERQYARLAHGSAQMLLALCNDVLDMARLDADRFELDPRATDLRELVCDVVQTHAATLSLKAVRIEAAVSDAVPAQVVLDPLRVRQVLMNLIGNAAKFTRKGRITVAVDLDVEGDGNWLRLAVSDTGIGMSAEVRGRLFDDFVQAHAGIAGEFGGTGLGLALCKRLVERMGGAIRVESEPGVGTTFEFDLPVATGPVVPPSR